LRQGRPWGRKHQQTRQQRQRQNGLSGRGHGEHHRLLKAFSSQVESLGGSENATKQNFSLRFGARG
jgi:hypothetical protein